MSWLYSIIFAGLLFPSTGADFKALVGEPSTAPLVQIERGDEVEKFDQTYPISPKGRVGVSNVNGSIVIEAWDRPEVRIEATKVADSRETLAEVQIKIDAQPDSLTAQADYEALKRDNGWKQGHRIEVQFRLWIPRAAVLNEAETVNGSVTVSNLTAFTKVSAVNGNVSATNLSGTAELSTVNGEVAADFERIDSGSRLNLNTVNGRVNLSLPSDVDATIKATSMNGDISNAFGLPVEKGKYVGRSLYGRIGAGSSSIRLESVNGQLSILRRNDGKSPNPAVNLSQKNGSADVEDGEIISQADQAEVNRQISRAARNASRTAAKAARQAQTEIEKIRPELDKIKIEIDGKQIGEQVSRELARQGRVLGGLGETGWHGEARSIQKKSKSFPVKGVPEVTIDADNAAVRVRGWDKPEVTYVLTDFSSSAESPAKAVTESASGANISITVSGGTADSARDSEDGDERRLEIFVPRNSNLLVKTSGEIRLEGVTGKLELRGDDGTINIRDAGGTLKVFATDGDLRVIGFSGALETEMTDGNAYLEGAFSSVNAKGGDGNVVITVQENSNLDISSNGEVKGEGLELKLRDGGQWQLGSGGAKFNFDLSEGTVTIRGASALIVN